jgi:hypothetical protein
LKGKTTVAKLYANFLLSLEVVSGTQFVETTARKTTHAGEVGGIAREFKGMSRDGGGVRLFTLFSIGSKY